MLPMLTPVGLTRTFAQLLGRVGHADVDWKGNSDDGSSLRGLWPIERPDG